MLVYLVDYLEGDRYYVLPKDIHNEIDLLEVDSEISITKQEISEEELKKIPIV